MIPFGSFFVFTSFSFDSKSSSLNNVMPLPRANGSMFRIISSIKFSLINELFNEEPPDRSTDLKPNDDAFLIASCGDCARMQLLLMSVFPDVTTKILAFFRLLMYFRSHFLTDSYVFLPHTTHLYFLTNCRKVFQFS